MSICKSESASKSNSSGANCCSKPDCSHIYMPAKGAACSCGAACDKCNGLIPTEEMVLDYIKRQQGVTCVELSRWFGKGTHEICKDYDENLIVAFGMSKPLTDIVLSLLHQVEIVMIPHPATSGMLIHVVDGSVPGYPIAQKLPKGGYKTPHWVPVTFDTREFGIKDLARVGLPKKDVKEMVAKIEKRRAEFVVGRR